MRKINEVLRVRFAAALNQEQIARSRSIGQSTVHRYVKMAAAAGLKWPLPEDYEDRQLNELLFLATSLVRYCVHPSSSSCGDNGNRREFPLRKHNMEATSDKRRVRAKYQGTLERVWRTRE